MTNPLPPDNRPYGSLFRTSEVLKVSMQNLAPYPEDLPNPHDELTEDTLCATCSTSGNVKNVNPLNIGDGTLAQAPEISRSYLWDFHALRRYHRCSLCRLVLKTFQPFYKHLEESVTGPPLAILGHNDGGKNGEPRSIEMIAMAFRNTLDNQDIRGSGEVYIYEDERIPHFNITQPAKDNDHGTTIPKAIEKEWRQTKILKNDEIDFDLVKRWITVCQTEHDEKCNGHENDRIPAKRLIDVETSCIVEGSSAKEYLTLSYVWGMAAQFMLTKSVVEESRNEGYFESLGTKIPESIRDAIQVCRKMGVRHLWVDVLCIVQDDDEDKADQIGLMDEIYGHALAVLVIAAGEGADNGIPGLGGKKRDLVYYTETVNGTDLITSLATTTMSAKRSLWNTRAWTYQEYILGNRLLVFTDTYVFFKCSTSMFRDDAIFPASGPFPTIPIELDDRWISLTLNDIREDSDPKKVWKDYYDGLLSFYLRRNMKFDSDALPAFSGVLKVLSKTLGSFHFGLPKKYFSLSLLWNDPHQGIFKRRADFPSWSWAGWQWVFEYFDAGRSAVGAYGYDMPKEYVPIQFFVFGDDGKLETFILPEPETPPGQEPAEADRDEFVSQFMSDLNLGYEELEAKLQRQIAAMHSSEKSEPTEESKQEEDERKARLMSYLDPPADYLDIQYNDLISRQKSSSNLIAFYTSVASLKVSTSEAWNTRPGSTLPYEVQASNGDILFTCYLDPAWRAKQPESLEFVMIGLSERRTRVALMLLEEIDGVSYRVNWAWKLSQHVSIQEWMDQNPVQKLIIWG